MRWVWVMVLTAASAMAQQIDYDPAVLQNCLDANAGEGRAQCIGTGADDCMQHGEGGTTLGAIACIREETQHWDGWLNVVYDDLLAHAQADDMARMQDGEMPLTPVEPLLRDMQRGWIKWRDATCGYAMARHQGGTIANVIWADCMMRLTAKQAIALEDFAGEESDG